MSDLTPVEKMQILIDDCTTMEDWQLEHMESYDHQHRSGKTLSTKQEIIIMNTYREHME